MDRDDLKLAEGGSMNTRDAILLNSDDRGITLKKILQLCPNGQEVCLIADEGCITSTPEIMIDFLIESVTESIVTNIEPENGVLKVWI